MAEQQKQGKKADYRCKFNKYDKDGNGKISKDEMPALLKDLNRDPTKFKEFDTDKSGFIEYGEFEQMMIDNDAQIERNLKDTFVIIDKDKSGCISLGEMDELFKSHGVTLSQAELKEELKKVDLNSDGKISFAEFKKMMSGI